MKNMPRKTCVKKMLEDTKDSLINYVDHINTVLEEAAGTQHPEERERLDSILSTLDIHPSAKNTRI